MVKSGRTDFNCRAIAFGSELYRQLVRDYPGNQLISPLSIHLALGLAYMGSSGKTKNEIAQVLQIPNDKDRVLYLYAYVVAKYHRSSSVIIANGILVKKSREIRPGMKRIAKRLLSRVRAIDFRDRSKAAKKINNWIARKTQNKIKNFLKPSNLSKDTEMILVNSVHVKLNWHKRFETIAEKRSFWLDTGTEVKAIYCQNSRDELFPYCDAKELDSKVIEIPFRNKDLSMMIILPNKGTKLDRLIEKFASVDFRRFRSKMRKKQIDIYFPKFRIKHEFSMDLKKYLMKMGLKRAFVRKDADFTGLFEKNKSCSIQTVFHRTMINVYGHGINTDNADEVVVRSKFDVKRTKFDVNRPFLFAVLSRRHRMFLLGACRDPTS